MNTPTENPSADQTRFHWSFHVLHALERLNRRHARQPPRVVYDPHDFAWTASLERHWRGIRSELERVLETEPAVPAFQEISPEAGTLTQDGGWQTFVLHAWGRRAARNCRLCPLTAAICESIPGMKTAFFSILAPGKKIPPHRGPWNGLLRCHLGLIVPPDGEGTGCWMRVGDQVFGWHEGRTVVFDDSFEHEVENATNARRVVLFIDVLRPVRFPLNVFNDALMRLVVASPYGRGIVRRFDDWYARRGVDARV